MALLKVQFPIWSFEVAVLVDDDLLDPGKTEKIVQEAVDGVARARRREFKYEAAHAIRRALTEYQSQWIKDTRAQLAKYKARRGGKRGGEHG